MRIVLIETSVAGDRAAERSVAPVELRHDKAGTLRAEEALIQAIVPLVNSRESASMPSEKITPLDGMSDSIINSWPCSKPVTMLLPESLLRKGSRTTQTRRRSSHVILMWC